MKSVFISHAAEDKEFVRKLASDLAVHGIRPWVDEVEIKVGDSLIDRINQGIQEADYILLVLSEASIGSRWVQEEIRVAVDRDPSGAARALLPVLIEDVELPPILRNLNYLDLRDPNAYERGLARLVQTIEVQRTEEKETRPAEVLDVSNFAKEVAREVAGILSVGPQGIREAEPEVVGEDPALVFVIMAFTSDMDPIYEGIKAAGDYQGLRVDRVKDVPGDYKITDRILEMIRRARLLVADLTHERPNVYFELGYARGEGKPVITTAREGTRLHFDVKDWTCTFYNDSRVIEEHLRKRFAYELGKESQ